MGGGHGSSCEENGEEGEDLGERTKSNYHDFFLSPLIAGVAVPIIITGLSINNLAKPRTTSRVRKLISDN
jgi:hypothetical protein